MHQGPRARAAHWWHRRARSGLACRTGQGHCQLGTPGACRPKHEVAQARGKGWRPHGRRGAR
eukprot:6981818-Lingulodinium_polyedra.AAC.1